jgi:flagellar basal body-associated protein FliL
MPEPKSRRKLWWIIALVAVVVLIALGLLAAWLYQDLLLQYD